MEHSTEFQRLLRQRSAQPRPLPGETARGAFQPRVKRPARRASGRRQAVLTLIGAVGAGLIAATVPGLWPASEGEPANHVDPWAESRRSRALLEPQEGAPTSLVSADGRLNGGSGTVTSAAAVSARFGLCHSGGGTNCVVDGDTFWMAGEKIRIADIDTPETHPPRCAEEARLGAAATRRLHALLNAGPITLEAIDRDTDRYGRKLRVVTRGGESLGGVLVDEGLARWYGGGRRSWCG